MLSPITAIEQPLVHGQYVLTPLCPGQQMRISDERFYYRTRSMTHSSESREDEDDAFVKQVRHRDKCCVVTGNLVAAANIEADYYQDLLSNGVLSIRFTYRYEFVFPVVVK
jgi:hypothetical protein